VLQQRALIQPTAQKPSNRTKRYKIWIICRPKWQLPSNPNKSEQILVLTNHTQTNPLHLVYRSL